ncbi:MAG: tetratricopeptide repeat protein [Bacteroidetes bacterium]|nr:tetratricopeptide repeat protein [Bacteroidota bacterium]
MIALEKIQIILSDLKNCSPQEFHTHITDFLEIFPPLSRADKENISSDFYTWADENKIAQPIKFCYAKYVLVLNAFFKEDYENTLLFCDEADELFSLNEEDDGLALTAGIRAATYRTLGNVDLALKYTRQCYEQLNKSGNFSHSQMAATYHTAGIYADLHQLDDALELYKSILTKAEILGNKIWVSNTLNGIGKVYLHQKKFAEAKEVLEKALIVSQEINNSIPISTALTDLGNYYLEVGDYLQAENYQKQALEVREQSKNFGGAITNFIQLGEIKFKEGNADDAIAMLNKAMKLAEEIKVKPKIYQIHLSLSKLFEHQKDLEKSLHHYKKFHEVREEVEHEDAAKKLKNMLLIFEAEQTKKENVIIKAQKLEIEQKNVALQETIDELTLSKINRKAKAITLFVTIALFIVEDFIIEHTMHIMSTENYFLSLAAKMAIIFLIKPIERVIEHSLLKKFVKKRKSSEVTI